MLLFALGQHRSSAAVLAEEGKQQRGDKKRGARRRNAAAPPPPPPSHLNFLSSPPWSPLTSVHSQVPARRGVMTFWEGSTSAGGQGRGGISRSRRGKTSYASVS